jgi:hypothetical protein
MYTPLVLALIAKVLWVTLGLVVERRRSLQRGNINP